MRVQRGIPDFGHVGNVMLRTEPMGLIRYTILDRAEQKPSLLDIKSIDEGLTASQSTGLLWEIPEPSHAECVYWMHVSGTAAQS